MKNKTDLERLIRANIDNVKKGNLSELVTHYYKSNTGISANEVTLSVRIKETGQSFELDLTEYFEKL